MRNIEPTQDAGRQKVYILTAQEYEEIRAVYDKATDPYVAFAEAFRSQSQDGSPRPASCPAVLAAPFGDVRISQAEYESLKEDSERLARLEANGVDNWEGYSEGIEDETEDQDES